MTNMLRFDAEAARRTEAAYTTPELVAQRREVLRLLALQPGESVLDIGSGPGFLAAEMAAAVAPGGRVFAVDPSESMRELARSRNTALDIRGGSAEALPLPDDAVDVAVATQVLEYVPDLPGALVEIRRVLRPGGLLLSLDFDRPANPLVRAVYLSYLTVVGSALGWVLHRDPDTYRYIPESIRRYPGAAGVAAMLSQAGFEGTRVVPLLGGLMAINTARRLR